MPEYWRVSPKVWYEPWSDDARVLALYLLTSEHRELEGLYRLPKGYACEDLGWSSERLAKPFAELLSNGFIEYDEKASVVLVRKALKYQRPENPNQVKHALAKIEELPETPLLAGLLQAAEEYAEPFAKRLQERFAKGFAKPPAPAPTTVKERTSSAVPSDDGFSDFWTAYPRRVGKAEAHKRWRRLTIEDRKHATAGAGHLASYVTATSSELKYVPHPATFIGPKRIFEDWQNGWPDGYGNNGSAKKRLQCPCGGDLSYDEDGLHCSVCGRRVEETV